MSRLNKTGTIPRRTLTSPVITSKVPNTYTHLGALAYTREAQAELFQLGLSNLTGTDTFHESAKDRDDRFTALVVEVAVTDPGWLCGYLPWLRSSANMRSAPLSAAVEAVRAMVAAKVPGGAALAESVMRRPDEPGETIAYHLIHHGRQLPIPLKRACARAAVRMYTQKAAVRYDTATHAVRFGDVIALCRPTPRDAQQAALFRALLDRAHQRPDPRYDGLDMLAADAALREAAQADPRVLLEDGGLALARAGWVFQDALPYAGGLVTHRQLWEAVIPLMGYEALLKNLAAFDRAGVSDEAAQEVCERLANEYLVRRAQVMPYQMLAAYEKAPSLRWGAALERALHRCVSNIPALAGPSLVLVDTSQSMTQYRLSPQSSTSVAKAAAVFAMALAHAAPDAQVFGFADSTFRHDLPKGGSLLRGIEAFLARTGEVGYGTNITGALRDTYRDQRRVFIFTDEQSNMRFDPTIVDHRVPIYVFNLGGYAPAYASGGNVHSLGGLSDATFTMVAALESRRSARWPWQTPTG